MNTAVEAVQIDYLLKCKWIAIDVFLDNGRTTTTSYLNAFQSILKVSVANSTQTFSDVPAQKNRTVAFCKKETMHIAVQKHAY